MAGFNPFEQPPEAAKHEPITLKRVAIGAGVGALLGAALALGFFAYEWLQDRDAWSSDGRFGQIVGMGTVIGGLAWYGVLRFSRRADSRVTPWVVAPIALWATAEQLVRLTPSGGDPLFAGVRAHNAQVGMAALVLGGVIAMICVAVVRLFDWHIARERGEIAREQAGQ